jgi:hypothetical protein
MQGQLLLIGSRSVVECQTTAFRDMRSVWPISHIEYAMPSETLLMRAEIVLVFEVENYWRFQQLRRCSEHQRRYGNIRAIWGFSRILDPYLAKRVREEGAEFAPVGIEKRALSPASRGCTDAA